MFGLGIPEVIVIVLAFALLFFGSGKILDFTKSIGRLTGEFKKGKAEVERELRASEDAAKDEKTSV